ncbi:hypothetical protein C7H19_16200 [Aphanothece hegewaldii CCALA 016]|uniref:Uncharacterized protein n=1 Tax=Aphanothece hegewaldii CCALA 016 TaxID=2107694 RepID=A0A2T1LV41_9CHRO|nr:hypothetical protein [Aphanothece hegewaldii]PSF35552.1 hypothetical protein C7H19_16200 [Aphanothece hegewaldii CCALA 016]
MLVSTFELLVKPQLPEEMDLPATIPGEIKDKITKLSRTVIQGYFLTISNLNAFNATISLVFTVVLQPPLKIKDLLGSKEAPAAGDLIGFLDVKETNLIANIRPDFSPNKIRFTRTIPASETGLFLLQPNILKPELLDGKKFEVRGYVEVFISSLSTGFNSARLLITPEQRGTFYTNLEADPVQLDQIAYALPTAHGGSLFELSFQ